MSTKLMFMKNRYKDLPKQHTKEWHEVRSKNIGSSELKNLRKNKLRKSSRQYEKTKQYSILTHEKENKITKTAFAWGRLSELMAKEYWKTLNFPEIHEFGAIPYSKLPLVFSPDGVYVHDNLLYLLEIKSSYMSNKCKLEEYTEQIQTGLTILPCDRALLFWLRLRLCAFRNLAFEKAYKVRFHKPWVHKDLAIGIDKTSFKENFFGFFFWESENKGESYHPWYHNIKEEVDEINEPTLVRIFLPEEGKTKEEIIEKMQREVDNIRRSGKIAFVKCIGMEFVEILKEKDWENKLENNYDLWKNYETKCENASTLKTEGSCSFVSSS